MNNDTIRNLNEGNATNKSNTVNNDMYKVEPDKGNSFFTNNPKISIAAGAVALGMVGTGVVLMANDDTPSSSKGAKTNANKADSKIEDHKAEETAKETTADAAETTKQATTEATVAANDIHPETVSQTAETQANAETAANRHGILAGSSDVTTDTQAIVEEELILTPELHVANNNVMLANFQNVPFIKVEAEDFNEAFAQAREQLGAGGAFEFDGVIYATYTQNEWQELTPHEQGEFQARAMDTYSKFPEGNVETQQAETGQIILAQVDDIPFVDVMADSFEDAFELARNEVGPGGAFLFENRLYATYTSEEWNNLPVNEQIAFQSNAVDTYHKWELANAEMEKTPITDDIHTGGHGPIHFAEVDADTFSEAFAQAREQVGPGGAFEWHGKIYGTYLADEWAMMTAEQKSAFQADVARSLDSDYHIPANGYARNDFPTDSVIETEFPEDPFEPYNPEFQVIGLESVMTEAGPMNFAGLTVDNDPLMLIDVDNDGVFDLAIHDDNYDGLIDETEIHDLSEANITIGDLADMDSSYMARNDYPEDYYTEDDNIMPV